MTGLQVRPRERRFPSIASFFSWQLWQRNGPSQRRKLPGCDESSCTDIPWFGFNSTWQMAHLKSLNIFRTGYSESSLRSTMTKMQIYIYNSWCKMLKIKSIFHLIVQDLIIKMKLGNQPFRKKSTPILKYFLHDIWICIFSICVGMGWWIRCFFLAEHVFEDTHSRLLFRNWHGRVGFLCYYVNDNTGGIIPQSFWVHSSLQKVSDM